MELGGLLLYLQEPATCFCDESDKSTPFMNFILTVQVIFICVYITNYLHLLTMFLSF